ncbi:terminase [Photobacterium leiognathi subsp. mandapamensis]|uniref:terminase n=1 Tax=Photobacterium leiognathi TaxID=553611 RepID=UPI003AF37719
MTDLSDIDYIKQRIGNKWWRLNNLYKVENEDGELVTFKLRPAQALLFKQMAHKNIILKARQLGFSTAIDIYELDEALFNSNIKCGIIAQDQNAAGEIFRTKIEIPYDNLPAWLKAEFPIESRRSGANGGYILFKNGSSIQCATSFRSGTVQRLHISEHGKICAKCPQKAKEVKTGTLNAIHQNAICFIESTAEGVGGDFHAMSMRALDLHNSGSALSKQDYKFHFFAWFQDPKYAAALPASGLQLSKHHQEYFAAVEAAMNVTLSDEQKQWYINKEIEQGEEIKQEFPSTPQEAFLTSGRRVFDAIKVMQAEAQAAKPLIIYDIEPLTGKRTKAQSMRDADNEALQRNLLNMLLVWELPDSDDEYAIGVDIAEGLEHNDRSSFDVVKKSTGEQVAHWFGHLDTELFASLVRHVGLMYNTAFVGPERNNHGHAFLQKFREIYPVRRIYQEQYLDRDNDNDTPKLGWLTTKQSKPIIIEGLKELLRTQSSGIRWIGTISELNSYVYDSKGAMNAQAGCFDDQLISYAIAQEMRARMPKHVKSQDLQRSSADNWMTK